MSDDLAMGETPAPLSGADLEELARCLHEADHLDPDTRARVAGLIDELASELNQPETSEQTEHLAQITTQLVRAVNEKHDTGAIVSTREKLSDAVTKAEATSPVASDIAMRLIDVLTSLGI